MTGRMSTAPQPLVCAECGCHDPGDEPGWTLRLDVDDDTTMSQCLAHVGRRNHCRGGFAADPESRLFCHPVDPHRSPRVKVENVAAAEHGSLVGLLLFVAVP
jgi:hypothetical protein